MEAVLAALGDLAGINRVTWRYAAASAAHILGIGLLTGPVLLLDLALLGVVRGLDDRARTVLRAVAALGVVLAALSGVVLLSARPGEYFANTAMLWKLGLFAAALANALAFETAARTRRRGAAPGRAYASTAALGSMLLWLLVLWLGRWVAFT